MTQCISWLHAEGTGPASRPSGEAPGADPIRGLSGGMFRRSERSATATVRVGGSALMLIARPRSVRWFAAQ